MKTPYSAPVLTRFGILGENPRHKRIRTGERRSGAIEKVVLHQRSFVNFLAILNRLQEIDTVRYLCESGISEKRTRCS